MQELLKKIKKLRKEHDYSQQKVADYLEIGRANYGAIERGQNKSFAKLDFKKLAELYDVPLSYFFDDEEIEKHRPKEDEDAEDDDINRAYNKLVADSVKNLRILRKIPIKDMETYIGMPSNEIKMYESGEIEIPEHILTTFANFLGASENNIIGFSPKNPENLLFLSSNQQAIKVHNMWYDQLGEVKWTEEEIQKLIEYAKFLIASRKK